MSSRGNWRFSSVLTATFVFLVLLSSSAWGWGYYAHELINLRAVDLMPDSMFANLFPARAYLGMHAPDPDLRREDPSERYQHYIDLDMGDIKSPPFDNIPRGFDDAVARIGLDSLAKMGMLPWRVISYVDSVEVALRANSPRAWKHMADLGHYIADAHMPMHTTVNYDGQLTNNRGVHFRFEWWMIEAMRDSIRWWPKETAILNPQDAIWDVLLDSYSLIDELLEADTQVGERYGLTTKEDWHVYERTGNSPDPRRETLYFELVGDIAVQRMNDAANAVASFWLTAWDRAGRPAWPPPPTKEKP